jgi:hypothetical protein
MAGTFKETETIQWSNHAYIERTDMICTIYFNEHESLHYRKTDNDSKSSMLKTTIC